MKDQYGRKIDYMRISITDRCNLRCRYCMPEGVELVSMGELLTYEEICRICQIAAEVGIRKLKITGGEPLVRRGCVDLIRELKQISGIEQVTVTTNGVLLEDYADALAEAGVDGVNISLDSLNRERYKWITGRDELINVCRGIEAILRTGVRTKINAVLQKDLNESEWESLVQLAWNRPIDVRFIEMMPIGYGKQFCAVSNGEILQKLLEIEPDTVPDPRVKGNGPARYYHVPGYQGSIGFISAIHGKFCRNCNRIRLTSQGQLKPCLCYGTAYDLRQSLREKNDDSVRETLQEAIRQKPGQHCFDRTGEITESRHMVQIGG